MNQTKDTRDYLPSLGRFSVVVVTGSILLLLVLVAIVLWVSAQRPPTTPIAPQR